MPNKSCGSAGVSLAIGVYLGCATLLAVGRRRAPEPMPERVRQQARALRETLDPREMNARQLRRLPGIGWVRSRAIVEAREAHVGAESLYWEDLRGIGPITAARIGVWLQGRGVDPSIPIAPGAAAD
ncbi:MAG: hypothetical protein CMJ89_06695 [Planctomycetes bacterium]|nr:hypothetical protein [Planctomycetota bacterium]